MKLLTPEKDGSSSSTSTTSCSAAITVVRDGESRGRRRRCRSPRPRAAKPRRPRRGRRPRRRCRRAAGSWRSSASASRRCSASPPSPPRADARALHGARCSSIVIGYYVIGKVHHALHTPLMSVTNAISGIIVVGALLQIAPRRHHDPDAVVHGDPAAVHQHLRRLRRDPPHAQHVLEGLRRRWTPNPIAHAAYIVAALLFILSPGRALQARDRPPGHRLRHRRHGDRAGRGDRAGGARTSTPPAAILLVRRRGDRRGDRAVAGQGRGDDRDARAHRAAAQLRRPGRGAGRLERLLRGRGRPERRPSTPARCCDIHHAEVFIGVFIGAVTFTGSIVAYLKLSAKIKSAPLMLPGTQLPQPRRARRVRAC